MCECKELFMAHLAAARLTVYDKAESAETRFYIGQCLDLLTAVVPLLYGDTSYTYTPCTTDVPVKLRLACKMLQKEVRSWYIEYDCTDMPKVIEYLALSGRILDLLKHVKAGEQLTLWPIKLT